MTRSCLTAPKDYRLSMLRFYTHLGREGQPGQCAGGLCARFMGVDGRVEAGVVVHLELAVELEAAAAREDLLPELVEAGGEVRALLAEQVEACEVALAMGLGGGGAAGLLGGVVELEREDGEAVEDEAGGFGVERGAGVLYASGGEKSAVDGFDQVVARLVECVDGAFEAGDGGVRGPGLADLVFFVP